MLNCHKPQDCCLSSLLATKDCNDKCDFKKITVYAEPFLHQVGGHQSMLCLDDKTVCKPYKEKEHSVYETLPDDVKRFVPQYKGLVDVSVEADCNGYLVLTAHLSQTPREPFNLDEFRRRERSTRVRLKQSGSLEFVASSDSELFEDENSHEGKRPGNPWAIRCSIKHINKLFQDGPNKKQRYIILENLVFSYKRPCILDLKMGFQQFPDNVSENKKRRFENKGNRSTTSTLGVRMCGMQVFDKSRSIYKCWNKYYGLELNDSGFHNGCRLFLNNGCEFLSQLVPVFIEQLQLLKTVLETQSATFRLYTSSLLLLYDGCPESDDRSCEKELGLIQKKSVKIRMIDFEHSILGEQEQRNYSGPDIGYLKGLDSVIETFIKLEDLKN